MACGSLARPVRRERERAAGEHVDDALLDEVEDLGAKLVVFVLAQAELVGERSELDARGDQAGQAIEDGLPIET